MYMLLYVNGIGIRIGLRVVYDIFSGILLNGI